MTKSEAIVKAVGFIEEGLSMLAQAENVLDSIKKPIRLGLALIKAVADSTDEQDVDLSKFEITESFEDKLKEHGVTPDEIEEALRN